MRLSLRGCARYTLRTTRLSWRGFEMLRVHGRIAVAASAALLSLTGAIKVGPGLNHEPLRVRPATALDSLIRRTYQWRLIGPDKGGRSIGVSGVKGRPQEAY